ncbi:hypothetical protein TNCV_575951 [Trichonephila clavipes]|nr:hypothetical protein TNCV_575951 [Trichonephila clavipes]
MVLRLQHSLRYMNDVDGFVQHIVAAEETWCHHFQPEGRQHATETSRRTWSLEISSSAVSQKGDVVLLMGQPFHSDGVKAAVRN